MRAGMGSERIDAPLIWVLLLLRSFVVLVRKILRGFLRLFITSSSFLHC